MLTIDILEFSKPRIFIWVHNCDVDKLLKEANQMVGELREFFKRVGVENVVHLRHVMIEAWQVGKGRISLQVGLQVELQKTCRFGEQ